MGSVITGKYKDIELREKNDAGEDATLPVRIYKMGARASEKWLLRALVAAMNGGLELPKGLARSSVEEMGRLVSDDSGFMPRLQSLDARLVGDLLDELLQYAWFVLPAREGNNQLVQAKPDNVDGHISSFVTLFRLKMEVLKLSFGF